MDKDARLADIGMSLEIAANWEEKGDFGWTNKCLRSALMGYLSIAVTECPSPTAGIAWLIEQGVPSQLERYRVTAASLLSEIDAKKKPASALGGNYSELTFAHIGWLTGRLDIAESLVSMALRPDLMHLTTPFWREYAIALGKLIRNQPHEVPQFKRLRGQERYWYPYLALIASASRGDALEPALSAIDTAFAERQSDKTIHDDNYQTEGSGNRPTYWDYRKHSLFVLIRR